MKSTFRILFYINRSKERNGLVPIFGRITINGTIAQFSCKCSVPENLWSIQYNCAKGKSEIAQKVNLVLDGFRSQIYRSYYKFLITEPVITARMIKEDILRSGNEYKTLLKTVDKEIMIFKERVGKDRAEKTYKKMLAVRGHLQEFIQNKYHATDIYMQEADQKFVISFSRYIRFEKGLAQSTVWVYCTFLKKVFTSECNKGFIRINPFNGVKFTPKVKEKPYLTEDEVLRIISAVIDDPLMNKVKEMFLFCCFTGLSFIDLKNLCQDNIKTLNGEKWIVGNRQKNNMPYQVKLLKYPVEIIEKYSPGQRNRIFELPPYEKVNRIIKELGHKCGIEKKITFHKARHSELLFSLKTSNLQN